MGRRRGARWAPLLLVLAIGGCGEAGVSAGATVTVYVSAPMRGPEARRGRELCTEAKRSLAEAGEKAGDLHVRAICLDASGPAGPWTLARVGANARQAVQDSTTVAYIGEPDRRARLQSRPIVEAAEIAEIAPGSGSSTMRRVLHALTDRGSTDPRSAVFESLSGE